MDELYKIIEEKIKKSGYPGHIDGEEFNKMKSKIKQEFDFDVDISKKILVKILVKQYKTEYLPVRIKSQVCLL